MVVMVLIVLVVVVVVCHGDCGLGHRGHGHPEVQGEKSC